MRDSDILRLAGVKVKKIAGALSLDPSTLSERLNAPRNKWRNIAFTVVEWKKILLFLYQTNSLDIFETLGASLIRYGRLGAEDIASARVFADMNMLDLCKRFATVGFETVSFDDLLYLSSAWSVIGGEFDMSLAVSLLRHRNKNK